MTRFDLAQTTSTFGLLEIHIASTSDVLLNKGWVVSLVWSGRNIHCFAGFEVYVVSCSWSTSTPACPTRWLDCNSFIEFGIAEGTKQFQVKTEWWLFARCLKSPEVRSLGVFTLSLDTGYISKSGHALLARKMENKMVWTWRVKIFVPKAFSFTKPYLSIRNAKWRY